MDCTISWARLPVERPVDRTNWNAHFTTFILTSLLKMPDDVRLDNVLMLANVRKHPGNLTMSIIKQGHDKLP